MTALADERETRERPSTSGPPPQSPNSLRQRGPRPWVRILAVIGVLFLGFVAMSFLASLREEPESVPPVEPVLQARCVSVAPVSLQATLRGFGTARPHRVVRIAPRVEGQVVEVHPRLEVGEIIREGELLFALDPTDFELRIDQAAAEVARAQANLKQLDARERTLARQLSVAEDARGLAERELERIQQLVQAGGVESQSRLDQARMAHNREDLAVAQLQSQQEVIPAERQQLQAQLQAAEAALDQARQDLSRARVTASITGRLRMAQVEPGQVLTQNAVVVEMADDSVLEIPVSLESREVAKWLGLQAGESIGTWFDQAVLDAPVQVTWTENPEGEPFQGHLVRVADFDEETRTFRVIVEVRGVENQGAAFPLTAGMFTSVAIPGRRAEGLIPVPRESIDSRRNVLIAENVTSTEGVMQGRLRSQPVQVARTEEGLAYVSSGLQPGDLVLTTRPPRVLDGSKVIVELDQLRAGL